MKILLIFILLTMLSCKSVDILEENFKIDNYPQKNNEVEKKKEVKTKEKEKEVKQKIKTVTKAKELKEIPVNVLIDDSEKEEKGFFENVNRNRVIDQIKKLDNIEVFETDYDITILLPKYPDDDLIYEFSKIFIVQKCKIKIYYNCEIKNELVKKGIDENRIITESAKDYTKKNSVIKLII